MKGREEKLEDKMWWPILVGTDIWGLLGHSKKITAVLSSVIHKESHRIMKSGYNTSREI